MMNSIPTVRINDELSLPVLGLGTWGMGGNYRPDSSSDRYWIDAISMAIEMGITHIDTAAMYGSGHTERLIGEAIRQFDRKKLFITTKVAGNKLQFADVLRSAEASCRRLKTDHIDLFLIHWPNPAIPLGQTMSAINKLAEDQLIRWFGVSNFPVNLMREAELFSELPLITNQVEYNLFTRNNGRYNTQIETEIIPYCLKKGISITAWRPLMKGDATNLQHPIMEALSKKYDKTAFQIALNWLIQKPLMLTIPKMSQKTHIQQNIEALHFRMEEVDYRQLDAIRDSDK
ncbi:MAG: aldo/keto reductase [Bacteroidales bacterium]|jgi:diketogulonate reductase-like aldo/keto reductase|nr:aldo/keto reductase [Bacteroidales bacterium]